MWARSGVCEAFSSKRNLSSYAVKSFYPYSYPISVPAVQRNGSSGKEMAGFSLPELFFPCRPQGKMVKYLRMSGQSTAKDDRQECPVNKEEKIVNIIETLEREQLRDDIPEFRPGDTVRVHTKVVEGKNERIQVFEGVVIARKHAGLRETFTVRRISYGVGVERTFFVHSPRLAKIEVKRRGIVRRAKLFYLRGLSGKAARIKERK